MYRQYNIQQFCVLPTQCICVFVSISEQTAIIPLYSNNWLVFITDTESVYCAVRTEYLYKIRVHFSTKVWQWPPVHKLLYNAREKNSHWKQIQQRKLQFSLELIFRELITVRSLDYTQFMTRSLTAVRITQRPSQCARTNCYLPEHPV